MLNQLRRKRACTLEGLSGESVSVPHGTCLFNVYDIRHASIVGAQLRATQASINRLFLYAARGSDLSKIVSLRADLSSFRAAHACPFCARQRPRDLVR